MKTVTQKKNKQTKKMRETKLDRKKDKLNMNRS